MRFLVRGFGVELVIENIRSDDALQRARAETFLLENPDPGVRLRPKDELERAIDTGQGLLVSDRSDICGISLVYQYDPGAPGHVDYEIGTMRVVAQGHGLQAFLAWFHLVQITLEDDASRGDIFAVVTPDTASAHNMTAHVRMVDWTPSDTLVLMRRAAGVPFSEKKMVLLADQAAISSAFLKLRALRLDDNRFRAPKGDAVIMIQMGWFSADLLNHVG